MIDIDVYPHFFAEICQDQSKVEFRKQSTGIYKPRVISADFAIRRMASVGIDKAVIHAMDLTTTDGGVVVSNDEAASIMSAYPGRFYAFGSVDPSVSGAVGEAERCFAQLGLNGLWLDPSKQYFYPDEPKMDAIYEVCLHYNKPVMFQGGISLEPRSRAKYALPVYLDEVLFKHPDLRVGVTSFGWPWAEEVATLMLKHPNMYCDTALMYFDSVDEFYPWVMQKKLGHYWIERSLMHQVMFGTCSGHFNQVRQAQALKNLDWADDTRELVTEKNALDFMGLEG